MTCWGSPTLLWGLHHDFQVMAKIKSCIGSIGPLKSSPNKTCPFSPNETSPHPLYSTYLSPPQIHCTKTLSSTTNLKPKSKLASHWLHSVYSVLTLFMLCYMLFIFQNTSYLRNFSMQFFPLCSVNLIFYTVKHFTHGFISDWMLPKNDRQCQCPTFIDRITRN